MKRNFTFDDLLLYHYGELSRDEIEDLETHLLFDEGLIENNENIKQIKAILDLEKSIPSDASIQIILDHNKQSSGELEII